MKKNWYNWLLQGGFVSFPKSLLAYMEPLGVDYANLGRILYMLYLEGPVSAKDMLGREAAQQLSRQGLILFSEETGDVDFTPLMERVAQFSGIEQIAIEESPQTRTVEDIIQAIVQETGSFLSAKEENDLRQVALRYEWPMQWLHLVYKSYRKQRGSRQESFMFYAAQVAAANIMDEIGLEKFENENDFFATRVKKILLKLGKYNNPTEAQKLLYDKWIHVWGFTYEMILLATEETVGADNPGFPYLDRVLSNWHDEHIDTPAKVQEKRQSHMSKVEKSGSKKQRKQQNVYHAEREKYNLTYQEE